MSLFLQVPAAVPVCRQVPAAMPVCRKVPAAVVVCRQVLAAVPVFAKTCQSAQVRHSPKSQLRLCRKVFQQFQHRQVMMVPRLQVS